MKSGIGITQYSGSISQCLAYMHVDVVGIQSRNQELYGKAEDVPG